MKPEIKDKCIAFLYTKGLQGYFNAYGADDIIYQVQSFYDQNNLEFFNSLTDEERKSIHKTPRDFREWVLGEIKEIAMKLAISNKQQAANIEKIQQEIEISQAQKWQALAMFHDGEDYDPERLWQEFDKATKLHGISALAMGRILICQKEMLPHGEFSKHLESRGYSQRTAQRYMKYTRVYAGFDPEVESLLGQEKLYLLAKKAPSEVLEKFQDDGKLGDKTMQELIAMSPREISKQIKDATQKMQYDLINEKSKNDALFEEKERLKKDNERLQKQLERATKGETEQPPWFLRGIGLAESLQQYAALLDENKPDLSDDEIKKQCEFLLSRIEQEFAGAKKYLRQYAVDPEAVLKASGQ